jgi:hypothetical protein
MLSFFFLRLIALFPQNIGDNNNKKRENNMRMHFPTV